MIVFESSQIAGYFILNGVNYPKGHFFLKYDNLSGLESKINFSLINIYDKKLLIGSRGFEEVEGVSSWAELLVLLGKLNVITKDSAGLNDFRLPMYQYFDEVGDGSGNDNMNVDGEITPVSFKIKPPTGKVYGVARIIVSLRDGGSMDSGGWGNSGGLPLPNGSKLKWHVNGNDIDLTLNSIKSHVDLAGVCYDMIHNNWGQGDEFITARFTFTKAGQFLMLNGDNGDYLEALIQDDLTYLVTQHISAQGYQI